jgi:hypothetical protein
MSVYNQGFFATYRRRAKEGNFIIEYRISKYYCEQFGRAHASYGSTPSYRGY